MTPVFQAAAVLIALALSPAFSLAASPEGQSSGDKLNVCVAVPSAVSTGTAMLATAMLAATSAGVTAVPHVSGTLILTGAHGYIAGTLGAFATVVGVLSSPVVVAVSGTTLVAAAGAGGYCWWQGRKMAKDA